MNLNLESMSGNFLETHKAGPLLVDEKRLSDRALLNKLQQFGIKVDKISLLKLGENVIAVEDVCDVLTEQLPQHTKDSPDFDSVFMSVLELWKRWYPDRITFEMLHDRLESIFGLLQSDNITAAARVWYKTWPLCLRFFDMCKIETAPEFRSRFPRYEELLDSILGVAEAIAEGSERRHFLDARISYEQLLERLSPASEQDDLTDGIRALLADSYMQTGQEDRVDRLFQSFLEANQTWSFAWSDWFYCYHLEDTPEKNEKAESILREGLKVLDAREQIFDPELHEHKKHLLVILSQFLEGQGRVMELQEIQQRLEEFEEPEDLEQQKTITAEDAERDEFMRKVLSLFCDEQPKAPTIGRNDRCPCQSGVKFKRCCGRVGY